MTLGQAFQMAYRRYVENEKADIKKNKDMISIGSEIEKMKTENVHLREKLEEQEKIKNDSSNATEESASITTPGNSSATNGNPDVSLTFLLIVKR